MPKIYTEEEKYQQKIKMYTAGLKMVSQNGYKNVKVDDLVEIAGVSKGLFLPIIRIQGRIHLRCFDVADGQRILCFKMGR